MIRHVCLFGGTRSSKTWLIVTAIVLRALVAKNSRHVILRRHANAARASISLETLPVVMRMNFGGIPLKEYRQDGFFELPTVGSQIWVSGLDDAQRVDKILGREYLSLYLNEASQIPYSTAMTALTRLAQINPDATQKAFVDLNPVGKSHWTNQLFVLRKDPSTGNPVRNPAQYAWAKLNPHDNAHNLSPEFLDSLQNLPERQRKRFLEGEFVDEVEGALWTYEMIEGSRCNPDDIPEEARATVVVAVDPSGVKSADDYAADEVGIIVAARGQDGNGYVLADRSMRGSPHEWATRAVTAFHEFAADRIVAEANFGGEMVRATIHSVGSDVPVRLVSASRGKAVRAEPIAALYEQGKIFHAGRFAKLEDQLCSFSPLGYAGADSPDHADACIWALTDLMHKSRPVPIVVPVVVGQPRYNPW